jgi:large repetitive protein
VTTSGATVTATVGATNIPDVNPSNNLATDTLSPLVADVSTTVSLPDSGTPGFNVTATVTYQNAATASGTITFTPIIGGIAQPPVTLAPGASTSLFVTTPVTTSGATVTATVGATNIPDVNPSNNLATDTLSPLVADVSTTVAAPASLPVGATYSATVTFVNLGGTTVTFTPSFTVNGTSVLGTRAIILSPGAFTTTQAPVATVTSAGSSITAGVGATSLPESTLTNNTATATVNPLQPNSSVSGRVWLDVNGDRIYNSGRDVDLSGYRVELINTSGVITGSATTSITGSYVITGQVPSSVAGTYTIRFRNPSGEVIVTTPFNQTSTTANGNVSTGTTTSVVGGTNTIGGAIDNVTLYVGDNTIEQNLPIDPSGVVYDAITRQPVSGAVVTLIGPDGNPVPGCRLVQGGATQTTDATGIYRFDIRPTCLTDGTPTPTGNYTLVVRPPVGYNSAPATQGGVSAPGVAVGVPSTVFTPPNLPGVEILMQPNISAPTVGVNGAAAVGSVGTQYFLTFFITPGQSAGVIHNHIPLDPLASGAVLISKVGDKTVAEVGDSVKYTIRIRNTSASPVSNVHVNDLLPAGFRYIPGTARLNATVLPDPAPVGNIGRSLTFILSSLGNTLTANTVWELTYFVRLGVGSQQGDGINRATAIFNGALGARVPSNTAQFRVRVEGGVFSNDGCIIGKVYVDCDGNHVQNNESGSRELGIPGVRLIMLDGTQITTDNEGKYSICGVKAQTHVIKVDRTTLPKGSRLLPSSNRNAGVGDSIFVDLKGGELARADFIEGSCSPDVLDQVKARRALGGVLAPEKEIPADLKIDNRPLQIEQQILPSLRPESPVSGNAGGKAQ